MGYNRHFADAIARLEAERRYRVFADLERSAADFPTALWHRTDQPPRTSPSGAPTTISAWAGTRR